MEAPPPPSLGRLAAGHFRIRGAGRSPNRLPMVGQVAQSTARFGLAVGRSLSGRQTLGSTRSAVPRPIAGLAVAPPTYPLLAAFWESNAAPALPRRGLRRVTTTSGLSAAGPATSPASLTRRLAPKVVPIRPPPEVRAAGPMSAPRPAAPPAAAGPGGNRATPAEVAASRNRPRLPAILTRGDAVPDRRPSGTAGSDGPTASSSQVGGGRVSVAVGRPQAVARQAMTIGAGPGRATQRPSAPPSGRGPGGGPGVTAPRSDGTTGGVAGVRARRSAVAGLKARRSALPSVRRPSPPSGGAGAGVSDPSARTSAIPAGSPLAGGSGTGVGQSRAPLTAAGVREAGLAPSGGTAPMPDARSGGLGGDLAGAVARGAGRPAPPESHGNGRRGAAPPNDANEGSQGVVGTTARGAEPVSAAAGAALARMFPRPAGPAPSPGAGSSRETRPMAGQARRQWAADMARSPLVERSVGLLGWSRAGIGNRSLVPAPTPWAVRPQMGRSAFGADQVAAGRSGAASRWTRPVAVPAPPMPQRSLPASPPGAVREALGAARGTPGLERATLPPGVPDRAAGRSPAGPGGTDRPLPGPQPQVAASHRPVYPAARAGEVAAAAEVAPPDVGMRRDVASRFGVAMALGSLPRVVAAPTGSEPSPALARLMRSSIVAAAKPSRHFAPGQPGRARSDAPAAGVEPAGDPAPVGTAAAGRSAPGWHRTTAALALATGGATLTRAVAPVSLYTPIRWAATERSTPRPFGVPGATGAMVTPFGVPRQAGAPGADLARSFSPSRWARSPVVLTPRLLRSFAPSGFYRPVGASSPGVPSVAPAAMYRPPPGSAAGRAARLAYHPARDPSVSGSAWSAHAGTHRPAAAAAVGLPRAVAPAGGVGPAGGAAAVGLPRAVAPAGGFGPAGGAAAVGLPRAVAPAGGFGPAGGAAAVGLPRAVAPAGGFGPAGVARAVAPAGVFGPAGVARSVSAAALYRPTAPGLAASVSAAALYRPTAPGLAASVAAAGWYRPVAVGLARSVAPIGRYRPAFAPAGTFRPASALAPVGPGGRAGWYQPVSVSGAGIFRPASAPRAGSYRSSPTQAVGLPPVVYRSGASSGSGSRRSIDPATGYLPSFARPFGQSAAAGSYHPGRLPALALTRLVSPSFTSWRPVARSGAAAAGSYRPAAPLEPGWTGAVLPSIGSIRPRSNWASGRPVAPGGLDGPRAGTTWAAAVPRPFGASAGSRPGSLGLARAVAPVASHPQPATQAGIAAGTWPGFNSSMAAVRRHRPLPSRPAHLPAPPPGAGFHARSQSRSGDREGGRLARTTWPEWGPRPVFPSSAAERFSETLRRAPAEQPRPLPHYFQPLARAIAGPRRVAMRTGPGTTAALAAAGKAAATIGGVIHLRRLPDRSARSAEIVAHELVHVSRPSSQPRFFGDDRPSPEESLAQHTGGLARALVAPRLAAPPARRSYDRLAWGAQGMPVSAMGGALNALSRHITPVPASVARTPETKTGGSLVERTAGMFRQSSTSPLASSSASPLPAVADPAFPRPGDAPIVRRSTWDTVRRLDTSTRTTEAMTTSGIDAATLEAIIDALEQRVIDELERRGLRHHPGVF